MNNLNDNEVLELYLDKKMVRGMFFTNALTIVLSLLFVLNSLTKNIYDDFYGLFIIGTAVIISILLFVPLYKRWKSETPELILTSKGMFYHNFSHEKKYIEWRNINNISLLEASRIGNIVILKTEDSNIINRGYKNNNTIKIYSVLFEEEVRDKLKEIIEIVYNDYKENN